MSQSKKPKPQWNEGHYTVRYSDGGYWDGRLSFHNPDDPDFPDEHDFWIVRRADMAGQPMRGCLLCGRKSGGKALVELPSGEYAVVLTCPACTERHDDRRSLVIQVGCGPRAYLHDATRQGAWRDHAYR